MKKMKSILLIMMLISALFPHTFAHYSKYTEHISQNVPIYINDVELNSNPPAFIYYSTTFLPLRAISENLGFIVEWNGEKNEVEICDEKIAVNFVVEQIFSDYDYFETTADFFVAPMIIEGRTFVPLRSIVEKLGFYVLWEEETESVYIYEKTASQKENPIPQKEVTVSNAVELLNEIESNKHIKLEDGIYNLSETAENFVNGKNISYHKIVNNYEGTDRHLTIEDKQLNIKNITNLTIEGINDKKAVITAESRFETVLAFMNCSDITLKNIAAKHENNDESYRGGIFDFDTGENIKIKNCLLSNGSKGIGLWKAAEFTAENVIIENCDTSAISLSDTKNCFFNNCTFRNNNTYYAYYIDKCEDVIFEKCLINDNSINNYGNFFEIRESIGVKFLNCDFKDNLGRQNVKMVYLVDFTDTTFENNEFDDIMTAPKYENIPLTLADVTFNELTFYMTMEDVIEKFSKPEEIKELRIDFVTFKLMIYDDMEVGITARGFVSSIKITNDDFQTARGIKKGSSRTDVLEAYGYSGYGISNDEETYYFKNDNWSGATSYSLNFEFINDIVTEIFIFMYLY